MSEQLTMMLAAGSSLLGLGIVMAAMLKGWQGWLDLKRLELTGGRDARAHGGAGEMIEVADLKERIRKLESIAACVDL